MDLIKNYKNNKNATNLTKFNVMIVMNKAINNFKL